MIIVRTVNEIDAAIVENKSLQEKSSIVISKFYDDMANDYEVKKARALIQKWSDDGRALDDAREKLRQLGYKLDSELHERKRFDTEDAARRTGIFDVESAYAFLTSIKCQAKSSWGNNIEMQLGLHRPRMVKDSYGTWKESFYLKKLLSNGVRIFHDYAEYGWVKYFAFNGCDLVGYYCIKRSAHPGDYTYIYAFVNQEFYNESTADKSILLKDWMAKLESSSAFVNANIKDNDTAKMLCKSRY